MLGREAQQLRERLLRDQRLDLLGVAVRAVAVRRRLELAALDVGQAVAVGGDHPHVRAEQAEEGAVERVARLLLRDREDRAVDHRPQHVGRKVVLRRGPLGNGGEVLSRLTDHLELRARALDRDPVVGLLFEVDRRVGQAADDVEELSRADDHRARLGDGCGGPGSEAHVEVRAENRDSIGAGGLHEQIRENGNRVLLLDDALNKVQLFEEIALLDRKLHSTLTSCLYID